MPRVYVKLRRGQTAVRGPVTRPGLQLTAGKHARAVGPRRDLLRRRGVSGRACRPALVVGREQKVVQLGICFCATHCKSAPQQLTEPSRSESRHELPELSLVNIEKPAGAPIRAKPRKKNACRQKSSLSLAQLGSLGYRNCSAPGFYLRL